MTLLPSDPTPRPGCVGEIEGQVQFGSAAKENIGRQALQYPSDRFALLWFPALLPDFCLVQRLVTLWTSPAHMAPANRAASERKSSTPCNCRKTMATPTYPHTTLES